MCRWSHFLSFTHKKACFLVTFSDPPSFDFSSIMTCHFLIGPRPGSPPFSFELRDKIALEHRLLTGPHRPSASYLWPTLKGSYRSNLHLVFTFSQLEWLPITLWNSFCSILLSPRTLCLWKHKMVVPFQLFRTFFFRFLLSLKIKLLEHRLLTVPLT